jgi:hypothetical protein
MENYDYVHYSLTGNQCSSYITQIGALIDIDLDANVCLPIDSSLDFGGEQIRLWEDPQYGWLPISSPDFLEMRLMELVAQGQAEYALDWYERTHPQPLKQKLSNLCTTITKFPQRCSKYLYMKSVE